MLNSIIASADGLVNSFRSLYFDIFPLYTLGTRTVLNTTAVQIEGDLAFRVRLALDSVPNVAFYAM